ncbi:MAG: hypothetical protein Q9162_000998 [Coniocarpon cinnabarinum]
MTPLPQSIAKSSGSIVNVDDALERVDLTSQLETLQLRLTRAEKVAKKKGTSDGDGKFSENVQRELALMTSAWYGTYSYIHSWVQ